MEVTPASTPERDAAQPLLQGALQGLAWLRLMWVDGGYSGPNFAQWVKGLRPKLQVEVVKRSDDTRAFAVLPRRWVVERSFGWLMRHRRLVRDYETTQGSAKAFAYLEPVPKAGIIAAGFPPRRRDGPNADWIPADQRSGRHIWHLNAPRRRQSSRRWLNSGEFLRPTLPRAVARALPRPAPGGPAARGCGRARSSPLVIPGWQIPDA